MDNNMTAANLCSAHAGESMAYQRYRVWGDHAKSEGYTNVSRLFEAVAYAERVHASNHFQELKTLKGDCAVTAMANFGIGSTKKNLEQAIAGENFEIEQMYPAYIAVGELQNEKGALRSMKWALAAEKIHAQLFSDAKTNADQGHDYDDDKIQICGVCGYTGKQEAPDVCPICGAKKDRFVEF